MKPTTLREKAAQLVFVRMGSNMTPPVEAAADAERILALLERCPVGGLILFNGSTRATPGRLAEVQVASPFPLLVGADIERGAGQQLRGGTIFPHARAFGALGTEAEAQVEAFARTTAREALACGVHVAFAPVADVDLNPRNPIIATRAFSDDPEQVARLVRAYVRGCRSEGLLTAAKHFPGHGRTAGDSHDALPIVEASRSELEAEELRPFRAAIEAGADFMMTAHVAFPALHDRATPATRSRPILHDLLRKEMGFEGLVVTDSLLMGAVRPTPEAAGRQAAALLNAGVDVLLDPDDPERVVEGLVRAVEEDVLPEARLEDAFSRVWMLKERMQARVPESFRPSVGQWERVDFAAHEAQARLVARRALAERDAVPGALPLDSSDDLVFLRVDPRTDAEDRGAVASMERALRAAFSSAEFRVVGPELVDAEYEALLDEARAARHVVVALVVEPAAWQHYGLHPAQDALVRTLTERRDVVVAAMGHPRILDDYPQASARLCTYSDVPVAQAALVEALAGAAVPY